MQQFIRTLPRQLARCFAGWRIAWHLLAVLVTLVLVESGLDWKYFLATRHSALLSWMFYAVPLGTLLPLVIPLSFILTGRFRKKPFVENTGWAIGQAELMGSLITSTYKAFTGRAHPTWDVGPDLSRVFHFGLLRGGVFWGWPSLHTAIAFAMAGALAGLFPRNRWLMTLAFAYALYVGLGVSMTIHWLSDFVAGAIIGTLIGLVVGKNFKLADEPLSANRVSGNRSSSTSP